MGPLATGKTSDEVEIPFEKVVLQQLRWFCPDKGVELGVHYLSHVSGDVKEGQCHNPPAWVMMCCLVQLFTDCRVNLQFFE